MALRRERVGRARGDESGQAVIEYVLMVSIVVFAYLTIAQALSDLGVADKLTRPIRKTYAAAYRYGRVDAKGFDDGGPTNHPRAQGGEGNFRIFINPKF